MLLYFNFVNTIHYLQMILRTSIPNLIALQLL